MPSSQKNAEAPTAGTQRILSKEMDPIPNFGPVFFQNQFRTTIELPTKEKYPDVEGKCAIVTGSNTGLGFESAKQLLSIGLSHLVMGVRSLHKGEAAATVLRAVKPSAKVEVWELDMESYESIQTFVHKCQNNLSRIDIVILNAGLAAAQFATIPSTGHERTIQVNHLSTVLLTILLLPVLKNKPTGRTPPRIIVVNSVTAHLCKFPNRSERPLMPSFDDVTITPWNASERYGVSKLLCQLFIVKLAESVNPSDVTINMVDPGLTKGTGLQRDATGFIGIFTKVFFGVAGRSLEKGAATYLDAALGHSKESHGCFIMSCKISPLACWFYTEGEPLTDTVWTETLQELKFANVEQIVASRKA